MAQLIRNTALLLFTEECAEKYFDDFDFLHGMFANYNSSNNRLVY